MSDPEKARVWQQLREAQTWSLPEFESEVSSRDAEPPDQPPTAAELAGLREQARQEGFREGQLQGLAEGRQSGEQAVREGIERLHIIASALAAPLDELDRDLEYSLVNLALILARRIVGHSVQVDAEALASLVRQSVEMIGAEAASGVDIDLNPRDLQFLREQGLLEGAWTLHADDSLLTGDVRVRRGPAEVDARLQQRLDRLAADMLNT